MIVEGHRKVKPASNKCEESGKRSEGGEGVGEKKVSDALLAWVYIYVQPSTRDKHVAYLAENKGVAKGLKNFRATAAVPAKIVHPPAPMPKQYHVKTPTVRRHSTT